MSSGAWGSTPSSYGLNPTACAMAGVGESRAELAPAAGCGGRWAA